MFSYVFAFVFVFVVVVGSLSNYAMKPAVYLENGIIPYGGAAEMPDYDAN